MQRTKSELNITRPRTYTYSGSFTDDDSGIDLDNDYSSSSDIGSTRRMLASHSRLPQTRVFEVPSDDVIAKQRLYRRPLKTFITNGYVERIRPTTMRNSTNGDFIVCQTDRGSFIAYRTPIVPLWVTDLVRQIELMQR